MRFFLAVTLAALASACEPPHCDHPDHGSCVQACCKLQFTVGVNATDAAAMLSKSFASGGPDGSYVYWATAVDQGPLKYVVQGKHWTAKHRYVDSLSFGVLPVADADRCTIVAFSHSQDFVRGDFAYGDAGQNYKNLVTIVEATYGDAVSEPDVLLGCPAPAF
eukprot:TRINITY_DN78_c14_g1_i1.p1 TRINITY_DN78_c14_g1~~TRINITY_DN78_c14_g1_i1.p1  ORF type:complete len:163 (+),score=38.32 TRINITY_DN78_c14_g1_i1:111-599(+)